MFAYILHVHMAPNETTDEFFRRFKEVPGLLQAYSLQGEEDPEDSATVAIWESKEAAERYLSSHPLRREVDRTTPQVTRTMYRVRDAKEGVDEPGRRAA